MKQIKQYLWMIIVAVIMSTGSICHAVDVELLQSTTVDNNALNFSSAAATFNRNINGRTYQRFPMATSKGYQYATYYDSDRYVCLARRKLPAGAWEVIRFTDYTISSSDSHNVVSVGICEKDGTIHLMFDHHKHPLNYRVSVLGAASDPEAVTWSTSLFSPVTSSLGSVGNIVDLTYPTFFSAPNGNLMLYYRFGGSGSGDGMIQEYNGTTHDWTTGLGKFISRTGTYSGAYSSNSTSRNPYINGISYAGNRLHASWGWRETSASAASNHDLNYAYSDDNGRTWRNSAGAQIGVTGSSFITLNSPGLIVASIPENSGLANQYTHYAFPDGSCHVMVVHGGKYQHYWRDAAGSWSQGTLSFSGSRPKLTGDDDGNLFLVYVSGGQPRIAKGVPNGGQTAWTWSSVYTQSGTTEGGEGQLDYSRWETERVLSRFVQESPSGSGEVPSPLHVFDYKVSNKATEPEPAHDALNVSTNPVLSWAAGIAGNTHRIYFGSDAGAVAAATTASPEYMGEQAGTSYAPAGPLGAGAYYWRIDEVEVSSTIHQGLVWSFRTQIALPPVIYQDVDLGEWNTASTWNPDSLPLAGHDYVSAMNLNVNDAASAFAGDSLRMDTGGSLRLRDSANTFMVNNLIMNGGKIYGATGNNVTFALDGNISILADTQFQAYWNTSGPRDLRIFSKVSGQATITSFASNNSSTHTLSVENAANDFSGTWICQNGFVDFTSAGAVGAADIQVLDNGKLSILGDWNANASLMVADAIAASVDLGTYNWVVTNLVFGSSTIPLGQHTAAELNAFGVNAVFTGSGTITVSDGAAPPPSPEVIAGWDIWNNATTPAASVLAANVTGSAVTTTEQQAWNTTDERGASNDGDWGTFAGPPAADTTVGTANDQNLTLPNATTGGTITFTVTNNGTDDIILGNFHFDAYAFRPKAPRTYELSVLAGGGISAGSVFTSVADAITSVGGANSNSAHDDIDIDLTGLADHTLAAGESVDLLLAFSGGAGDASGGHHLFVDNAALSGSIGGGGPVNQPPAFTADPFSEVNGDEGVAYSSSIADNASDPEADPMTFSKVSGPAWLSVAANGTLSGTPGAGDVGLNVFTVQVSATGGSDTATLNITVDAAPPVNQPPAFTVDPFSEVNGDEGVAYSGTIGDDASDPESDPMTFSKVSGPAWLSVAANGALSGTPGAGDVGLNVFTVQVSATGGSDTATLNITVDAAPPVNQPPAFTADPFSEVNGDEGVAYSATIADDASDPEADPMTFSKVSGPAWLSVAANGSLSGTPGAGDVGLNVFTVQVDAAGGSDTAVLEITVVAAPVNQPPAFTLDPFSKANATEDAVYSSSIAGDASDPESDPMTFSKVSGPAWLSIASSGALSGTPGAGDVGLNSFTVQVDAAGGSDTAVLEITVVAAPVNQPPAFTLDPFSKANATEDAVYSGSIAGDASDPESDPMTFSKVSGPAWLSIASSGALSGTPGAGDVGLNSFTVQVDAAGGSDAAVLEITVDASGGPVADFAQSESTVLGLVTGGSISDTLSNDDIYEVLTEAQSGGNPSKRRSQLDHTWTFNVTGGELVTFYVEAHHDANSEGDDFTFSYSTDNVNFTDMVIVTKTADDNTAQFYSLPGSLSGTVYVKVVDTDRSQGNSATDSLYVDALFITSEAASTPPGVATSPNPIDGATGVATAPVLTWSAGMLAASHDVYFGTSPSPTFQGSQSGTSYSPGTLATSTTYYWAVDEVNGAGTTTGPVWSFTTAAATPEMHVSSITLGTQKQGKNYKGTATITIVDSGTGLPVSGATVSGDFTGAFSESGSVTTDASGEAALTTGSKIPLPFSFTFTVSDVTASGYVYNPANNVETSDSGSF